MEEKRRTIEEDKKDQADLTLWCDGSKLNQEGTGAAVVWKLENSWLMQKVTLGKNKEIFDTEIWGVSKAVKVAEQSYLRSPHLSVISIFCDSQHVINRLKVMDCKAGQALKAQIYQKVERLIQQGHEISLRWVPSHSKVEGNEMVDKAAKEAAEGARIQTVRWTSQNHLKSQITEAKKSQLWTWYEQKIKERESRKSGFYVPSFKAEMDLLLGNTKKFYALRFYQLKTGHGAIGTFLSRIRAIEAAECWWCGAAEQSVMHLYTKCRKWRVKRRTLRKNLRKAGVEWQRRPEKRWLAQLLADRHAVGPLLEILENTEVGSRGGAAERKVEWQQRRDQEGEDQLGEV